MRWSGVVAGPVMAGLIAGCVTEGGNDRAEEIRLQALNNTERVVALTDQRLISIPLTVGWLDSLPLTGGTYIFTSASARGRLLKNVAGWMAVSRLYVIVPPDSVTEYFYEDLLALESLGVICDTTQLFWGRKRALVRGDSLEVVEHLANDRIAWYTSPDWEPEPTILIELPDSNTTCPYAAPDTATAAP